MTTESSDIIRGTADMLILKLLEIEPMHGWGLGQAMQRLSRDALRIQPGALYAISAAFARAAAVVHTARIASAAGMISDRFAVSDRLGRKLSQSSIDRIRMALSGEDSPNRWRRLMGRRRAEPRQADVS